MTKPIERYDKAIEHFNKAIKLNPRLRLAYINHGVLYARKVSTIVRLRTSTKQLSWTPVKPLLTSIVV